MNLNEKKLQLGEKLDKLEEAMSYITNSYAQGTWQVQVPDLYVAWMKFHDDYVKLLEVINNQQIEG